MAIQSVKTQSVPAFEIIVVDDSSTDGSTEIVRNIDHNIRIISVNRRNAAAARNVGINSANGEWIALLDADDVWYPCHLERAQSLLSNSPDKMFMSSHDWIDLSGNIVPLPIHAQCQLKEPATQLTQEDYFRIDAEGFHFGHSTVVYHRNSLLSVGGFDESQIRRHDIDLWIRMSAKFTWTYDTIKGAGYRESTPGSISRNEKECDYYYLRALNNCLTDSSGPFYRSHLRRQAQRALGRAITEDREYRTKIFELAERHMPLPLKLVYKAAYKVPSLAAAVLKIKRRLAHNT